MYSTIYVYIYIIEYIKDINLIKFMECINIIYNLFIYNKIIDQQELALVSRMI